MFRRIALLCLVAACAAPAREKPSTLPQAQLQSLEHGSEELTRALGGRPALVSLWATWCDACQKEMPDLAQLDTWAKEHGGVVMGVAVGEPVEKVKTFASAHRMAYPILVDEDFRLADALGEKKVPTTLVIDRTGRIVFTGGALDDRSRKAFEALF
ncbi:MAG: TlpA disulfide reductase family protein [Labilithrix sp.]